MKKKKLKIGVDVDGVIFDYMVTVRASAELYDYCELHKNGVINKEPLKVGGRYDWTKEERQIFADRYFVELSKTTPFNPLAVEIINRLVDEGHELYIISNRGLIHEEAITVIEERFKKANLKFTHLFWKIDDKTEILLDNNMNVIIDDAPEVCEEAVNNGLIALYFREKDSRKLEENNQLYEVDNWGQIYRYINEIANKK